MDFIQNLRSLGLATVLPTAITSSTLLTCFVGTSTCTFKDNIAQPQVPTESGYEGCNGTFSRCSSGKETEHKTTVIK
jgi:hypothetical protein